MGHRAQGVKGPLLLLLLLAMESQATLPLVPQIPEDVTRADTSIFNLWEHALRQQKDEQGQPIQRNDVDIRTLLSPEPGMVTNLAPMDGPHPLYSNDYTALRTEFLLDYMIQDPVLPDDEKLTQPDGLTVTNLFGKPVTFKKDAEGKITVEGVAVEKTNTLTSGRTVYNLSNLLFDHRARSEAALEELRKKPSNFGPFGRPLGPPPRPVQ